MKLTPLTKSIYELSISQDTEYAKIYLLQLFPNITLGINYINIHQITGNTDDISSMDTLRINYCFEGRCEVKLEDGRYVYVDQNALCIEDHEPQYNFHYPLGLYKGIQIFIHKSPDSNHTYDLLQLFGISIHSIFDKYTNSKQTFIQAASEQFSKKAAEILSVWENKTFSYEQKIQQIRLLSCYLLYYLIHDEAADKSSPYKISLLSQSQYMIAIGCEKLITTDLSHKHTIESLSAKYKISPSSLKNYFFGVYGCSISEYTQLMRVKHAKTLLETTNLSIMQIATSVGYENQSKFSAVFKKHTGYAPLEYKKLYNIKRNEGIT